MNSSELSEISPGDFAFLIEKAKSGEVTAMESIIRFSLPKIRSRLAAKVRDFHAREDITQEIMILLCARLTTLQKPDRFLGWLNTLADNVVHAWYRRVYRQGCFQDELNRETDCSGQIPTTHPVIDIDLQSRLAAAYRTLSGEHQAVLQNHYLDNKSYAETGHLLGLSEDQVRSRLQKARNQIKRKIHAMKPSAEPIQLSPQELDALRASLRFVSNDPARPGFNAICLEPKGRIVTTDGRRILFRQVKALATLTRPIFIGPCKSGIIPDIKGGSLRFGLTSASLEDATGQVHELPVMMEVDFPPVNQVIPSSWGCRMSAKLSALLGALDAIIPMLEPRHPAGKGLAYNPTVRLRLDPDTGLLLLETDKMLGYTSRQGEAAEQLADIADWRQQISLNLVRVVGGFPEKNRVLYLNAHYLRDALTSLGVLEANQIELLFQEKNDAAIGVANPLDPAQFALVMPIRQS